MKINVKLRTKRRRRRSGGRRSGKRRKIRVEKGVW